jgi:hypothetical protein
MNVVVKSNWKILPIALKERHFRSITTATVDGELWHTVQCKPEVSAWVRSQPGEKKLWFQNIDEKWMTNANTFDVHPTVYTMMCLRWSS